MGRMEIGAGTRLALTLTLLALALTGGLTAAAAGTLRLAPVVGGLLPESIDGFALNLHLNLHNLPFTSPTNRLKVITLQRR